MDRRFICKVCGTKWFLHAERAHEPDLEECGRCGGPLERFAVENPLGPAYPRASSDLAE